MAQQPLAVVLGANRGIGLEVIYIPQLAFLAPSKIWEDC